MGKSKVWHFLGWLSIVLAFYFATFGPDWSFNLSLVFLAFTFFAAYMDSVEEEKEKQEEYKRRNSVAARRTMDFVVKSYAKLGKMGYVPLENTTVSLVGVLLPPLVVVQYGDALSTTYKFDEFDEEFFNEGFALVSKDLIAVFLVGEKETSMVFAKKQ